MAIQLIGKEERALLRLLSGLSNAGRLGDNSEEEISAEDKKILRRLLSVLEKKYLSGSG